MILKNTRGGRVILGLCQTQGPAFPRLRCYTSTPDGRMFADQTVALSKAQAEAMRDLLTSWLDDPATNWK